MLKNSNSPSSVAELRRVDMQDALPNSAGETLKPQTHPSGTAVFPRRSVVEMLLSVASPH
jgi:hypothetical protein